MSFQANPDISVLDPACGVTYKAGLQGASQSTRLAGTISRPVNVLVDTAITSAAPSARSDTFLGQAEFIADHCRVNFEWGAQEAEMMQMYTAPARRLSRISWVRLWRVARWQDVGGISPPPRRLAMRRPAAVSSVLAGTLAYSWRYSTTPPAETKAFRMIILTPGSRGVLTRSSSPRRWCACGI
jgi:hypothetical protein